MSASGTGRVPAPVGVETAFTDQPIVALRERAPEIYEQFIKEKKVEWRHLRRLAWADLMVLVVGHVSGLVALACLTAIAWHAIDRGDATQGASIICTGAVSIVAVFVTGRLTNKRGGHQPPSRSSE